VPAGIVVGDSVMFTADGSGVIIGPGETLGDSVSNVLLDGARVPAGVDDGDSVTLKDDGFGVAVRLGNTLGESVRTPDDLVPLTADGPVVAFGLGDTLGISVGRTPGDRVFHSPLTVLMIYCWAWQTTGRLSQ
jgi:hypothetical protein